ncbi:hypothetical protein K502DRAFT_326204 [Neoconidiobolus thromboides FSU 785]|nr:hypothetical protein K502DRAFT_326204 [Neoconidiobolus thromboides FSU 785]
MGHRKISNKNNQKYKNFIYIERMSINNKTTSRKTKTTIIESDKSSEGELEPPTHIVKSNAYIEYIHQDKTLIEPLNIMDISLVNRFYLVTVQGIRDLISDSEIIFLKQNSNIPSYKLVLLSLALIGLHYIPTLGFEHVFNEYLHKVNLLFYHINLSSASNELQGNMAYYVNIAITLLSYLPHPNVQYLTSF